MIEIIKLIRTTVEKYNSCPRCCVLDKKYQMALIITIYFKYALDNLLKMNLILWKIRNHIFIY